MAATGLFWCLGCEMDVDEGGIACGSDTLTRDEEFTTVGLRSELCDDTVRSCGLVDGNFAP